MPHRAESLKAAFAQALMSSAPVLVVGKDVDGVYRLVSPEAGNLIGLPTDAIVGKKDHDLFDETLADLYRAHDRQVMELGQAIEFDEDMIVDGEARYWRFTKFPLYDECGTLIGTGSLGTDLSERRAVEVDLRTARTAAEAAAADLRAALQQMEHLAVTDRLTGVWNRRRLEEVAALEIARGNRYRTAVSMLIIDLDHFKDVNDRLGHSVGDSVLVEFCRRVENNIREADAFARWGGEEFIVMVPSGGLSTAAELAEKLRHAIRDVPFRIAGRVTVSIGVAEHLPGERFDTWIRRADTALYRAKRAGRDRVELDTATGLFSGTRETPAHSHFVQLVWRPAYACGHPAIDEQHQGLFVMANDLLRASLQGESPPVILRLAGELQRKTISHFAYEEALLGQTAYPDLDAHRVEHQELLRRAEQLWDEARSDTASVAELFQFLAYDVIAHHLLGADRLYFPYLEQRLTVNQ